MSFPFAIAAIWASMHAYVFLRAWAYTGVPGRWAALAAPVWVLLMASPLFGVALDRAGLPAAGRLLGVPGMVWAGFFFLLFCVSLLHDLYNGVLTLGSFAWPAIGRARLLGPRPIVAEAVLVALVSVYAIVEAGMVRVEHVVLPTSKLPPGRQRIRIVQVADLHLGLSVGRRRLERVIRLAEASKPDLIVSSGDLVDSSLHGNERLAALLAGLKAPLGKFASTGNHEFYAGLPQALEFTREAGFEMLRSRSQRVTEGLTIAGFDDPTALQLPGAKPWDEEGVLRGADQHDFVLVLKHRPPRRPDPLPLRDLQLSGHTHGGQSFPFAIVIRRYYAYPCGLVQPSPGHYLYTSRGTGTWGPPMRLFSPPEVTVIDLVPAGQPAAHLAKAATRTIQNTAAATAPSARAALRRSPPGRAVR
jgi:predicted MPP superfamily phosphohydrolase